MSKIDRILEKLRKLMNLQQSAEALGNEGEAHAAAAGISRLLLEYNLTLNDIPDEEKLDNPVVSEDVPFKRSVPGPWFEIMAQVCCTYNFCRPLKISKFNFRTGRYAKDSLRIVGRKKNVEIVMYLLSFLEHTLTAVGKKKYPLYRKDSIMRLGVTPKTEPMFMRSFLAGAVYGLRDQFVAQQGKVAASTDIKALVKSSDADIDAFLAGQNIGTARASKAEIDSRIAREGYSSGREVQIHKGIYANSVSEDLRLEQK